VHGLADGEVLLRSEAQERLLDHPGTQAARHRYGIIATARIHHDRLRCKGHRGQAFRQLVRGVAGDDDERQGKRFGHSGRQDVRGARDGNARSADSTSFASPAGGRVRDCAGP